MRKSHKRRGSYRKRRTRRRGRGRVGQKIVRFGRDVASRIVNPRTKFGQAVKRSGYVSKGLAMAGNYYKPLKVAAAGAKMLGYGHCGSGLRPTGGALRPVGRRIRL